MVGGVGPGVFSGPFQLKSLYDCYTFSSVNTKFTISTFSIKIGYNSEISYS